jgi:hypothetical protein
MGLKSDTLCGVFGILDQYIPCIIAHLIVGIKLNIFSAFNILYIIITVYPILSGCNSGDSDERDDTIPAQVWLPCRPPVEILLNVTTPIRRKSWRLNLFFANKIVVRKAYDFGFVGKLP